MEERNINETESLELISKMIKNARTNQRAKINCNTLLIWGYTTVIITIIVWLMKIYGIFAFSSLLWLIIPIICYPVTRRLSAKENIPVKTYIDRMIDYITILFTIVCSSIALLTIWINFPVILAVEGILFSMWAVIIGVLVKYKPIIYGGIVGILISHGMAFITNMNDQIPVFAIIVVFAIIIPGHIFNKSITKNV